jgi:Fe-S cluster assembly scaffold protein SufB
MNEPTKSPIQQLTEISEKSGVPCEAIIALAYRAKKEESKYKYIESEEKTKFHIENIKALVRLGELQKAENDKLEQDIRNVELKARQAFLQSTDSTCQKEVEHTELMIRKHNTETTWMNITNPVQKKSFWSFLK